MKTIKKIFLSIFFTILFFTCFLTDVVAAEPMSNKPSGITPSTIDWINNASINLSTNSSLPKKISNKLWNKNFGGSNIDYFNSVTQISDGGYIAVGYSESTDGDETKLNKKTDDAIIVKYDVNGNKLWNKNFGGSGEDYFNSVTQASDGGYIAVGYSESTDGDEVGLNKGDFDAIIVKYDANGNKLWNKNFGGSGGDYFQSVTQTSNGGVAIVGGSQSNNRDEVGLNKGGYDSIIVEYNSNGNKLWNKNFGGSSDDEFYSVTQTSDSGYAAVGYCKSSDGDETGLWKGGNYDAIIVKYDSNGNKLWNKNFGGSNSDVFNSIIQTANGGFAAVGYSNSIDENETGLNKGNYDGIIVEYDYAGNKVWNKNFGGSDNDYFKSIVQTADGGYITGGNSNSIDGDEDGLNKGNYDGIIVKYDYAGNKVWNKNFGGSGNDYFQSVTQTQNGEYVAAGYSNSIDGDEVGLNKGDNDAIIVKYNYNGDKLWNKNFGGSNSDCFNSIIQTANGGYVTVGYSESTDMDETGLNKGSIDTIIAKYDYSSFINQYQIDGGPWTDYSETITISAEGIHTINARTNDNLGNLSSVSTAVVKIDKTSPEAAEIIPSTVNWTNNDVTISINYRIDTLSGTAKSQYQIDSGTWTDYSSIITVTNEGIHTINAKVIDKAGNLSSISSTIIKIDKTSAVAVVNPSSYDSSKININYSTTPNSINSIVHLNNIIDNLSGVSNVKVWFTSSNDISNTVDSNCLNFDITSGTTDKDLSIQLLEDSIYGDNIHFEITDNAGNKSYFYGNIQLEISAPEVPAVSGIVNDKLYLKGENININWTYKDDNTPVLPQSKADFIFTNVESNSIVTKTLIGPAVFYQIPVNDIPNGITKVKVRIYNFCNKYSDSSEFTIRINRFSPNGKVLTKTIELADNIQFTSVYTDYVMPKNTNIQCILYYWNKDLSCFDENHKIILDITNKNALVQLPYSTNKFKIKYTLSSKDIINVAGTDYAKVSPTITSCRLYGK